MARQGRDTALESPGETLDSQWRERLNEQIEEGLAQLDRGEGIEGEEALQALWEKSRKRREAR